MVDQLLLRVYNLLKKKFSSVNLTFDLCHEGFHCSVLMLFPTRERPLKFLCRTELHALIVRYGCAGTEQHYWHFCNVSKTAPNCTEFWDRSPNVSCQNINSRLLQKWLPYSLCIYYLSLSLFGAHIQTSYSALAVHGGRTVLGCAHLFLRHVVISSEGRLWILLPTSVSCRLEEPHLHHTFPLGVKNRLKMWVTEGTGISSEKQRTHKILLLIITRITIIIMYSLYF